MPTLTVANRNFNASPQVFGPVSVPQKAASADFIFLQLTSNNWAANPGRRLVVLGEQSLDGGATWKTWFNPPWVTGVFSAHDPTALPSILLKTNDGGDVALARQVRVTISAPDGVVNAGAVITY